MTDVHCKRPYTEPSLYYCKSCKHEKLEENEPPCDECLEHPVNLNSHKPINYEDKSD